MSNSTLPTTFNPSNTSDPNYNPDTDPYHLYGYIPTMWICITFVTLFSITTAIHVGQAVFIKPRLLWLIPTTAMCGMGEIIGWSGRLWDSKNPINHQAFLMQIATTIIAPVFLTAAMYTILGILIDAVGVQYSRLKPKTYLKVFVTLDIFALIVQAAGGAIASIATTDAGSNNGSHVMLAGIFIQMFTMLGYTSLAVEFLLRFYLQKPFPRRSSSESVEGLHSDNKSWNAGKGGAWLPPRLSLMVLGLSLATLFVFIRTGYRTVELLGGWHGHIIRTQIFFDVLDATPIILALFTLNLFSPSILLRTEQSRYDALALREVRDGFDNAM